MVTRFLSVIVAIAVIAALLFYLYSPQSIAPEVYKPAPASYGPSNLIPVNEAQSQVSEDEAPPSYLFCKHLSESLAKHSRTWFRNNYESWDSYLEEGYSLDDVTLAIDHFGNSNFAASFRSAVLKRTSSAVATERAAMEEFERSAPADVVEAAQAMNFQLKTKIPSPALIDFMALAAQQRREKLAEQEVTVDDIAYFISHNETNDEDIVALLTQVDNPSATVGYDDLEAISLLDYAAWYGRPRVLEVLLSEGLFPTHDVYLGSTMEWALARLDFSLSTDDSDDAVEVVQQLKQYDAAARFSKQNESKVEGRFPRRFYYFDEKQLSLLNQKYGLELTTILQRDAYFPDQKQKRSALVKQLRKDEERYLNTKLLGAKTPRRLKQCDAILQDIQSRWQPDSANKVLAELQEQFGENKEDLKKKLASIDPVLVDLNTAKTVVYPQHYFPEGREILRPLRGGDIAAVLEQAAQLNLTVTQKNWLVMQILQWDARYFAKLRNSSLYTQKIPYYGYPRKLLAYPEIKTLIEQGVDLEQEDNRGKTLLYYAVQNGDLELLRFLARENYPFHFNSRGEDPLHLALYPENQTFPPRTLPAVVDQLMLFRPIVDQYHLARMALIKLYYPDIFQQIVKKHPQLKADDDTFLPKVKL